MRTMKYLAFGCWLLTFGCLTACDGKEKKKQHDAAQYKTMVVGKKEQNEEESRLAERYLVFLVPGLALVLAGAALSKGRFAKTRSKR